MYRGWKLLFFITIIILILTFFPSKVYAKSSGQAGVGVLSAPPQFSMIRLVQQDEFIRAYITVSDINSWEDIFSVKIILKEIDVNRAEFSFQQYIDQTSWEKINAFEETSNENDLLELKRCSYDTIDLEEILGGCYLNLIFVFEATQFSNLNIIAYDRGGANSTLELDYSSQDIFRSGDIIIIPGIGKSFSINIPGYILDIIALILSSIGTWYVIKKRKFGKLMSTVYEKN